MATPVPRKTHPHTLFVMQGTLNAGGTDQEIWQCGVRCVATAGGAGPVSSPLTVAANLGPQVATWFAAKDSTLTTFGIMNIADLRAVKVSNIGADALYDNSVNQGIYVPATYPIGGSTVSALPPVLTLAASWTTAARSGLASKGRVYMPWAIPAQSSLRVPSNVRDAINRRMQALLTLLFNAGLQPCVVSVLKASDTRTPGINNITGVRVGDVVDIQRRRKNKLREQYQAVTWP